MIKPSIKPYLAIFIGLFLPFVAFAEIEITEIMYNLEGADSGREWVEICNAGSDSINISELKFFENGTNHGLILSVGNESIISGSIAIIADNPTKFLTDWPSFSGNLFDSSFSLSNTGETLEIRDSELATLDSVSYLSDRGADGDGNSLTKSDENFSGANPSPGSASCVVISIPPADEDEGEGGSNEENIPTITPTFVSGSLPSIKVFAGEDLVAVVGSDIEFEAYTEGLLGEPLEAERYLWTFGDGGSAEGKSVFHNYAHPGDYIVFLDVSSGITSTSDRFNATIVPADISISNFVTGADGYIEITNDTAYELNISGWYLKAGRSIFAFPKNSILVNTTPTKFPAQITGIVSLEEGIELMFPNGAVAVSNKSVSSTVSVISNQIELIKPTNQSTKSLNKSPISPNGTQSRNVIVNEIKAEDEVLDTNLGENALQEDVAAVGSLYGDSGDKGGGDSGMLRWLVSLFILIAGASIGVIIMRNEGSTGGTHGTKEMKKLAESIEIVE